LYDARKQMYAKLRYGGRGIRLVGPNRKMGER
jgi:hypothetical protein